MARAAWWVWLLVAIGCSSSPAPPKTWSIQVEWAGGPPPGASSRSLLRSNGRYESTNAPKSGGQIACNAVLPPDAIAPITAALTRTKLELGVPADRVDGSIATFEVITIGAEPHPFPPRKDAPALWAAYEAAVTAAETQCAAAR